VAQPVTFPAKLGVSRGENSGQTVAFLCAATVEAGLRFWPFAGKSDIRAAEDQR